MYLHRLFLLLILALNVVCDGENVEVGTDNLNANEAVLNKENVQLDAEETKTIDVDHTNATLPSVDEATSNTTTRNVTYKVACLLLTNQSAPVVEIVNSTTLLTLMQVQPNITSPLTAAHCLVVLFYAPSCPFSCMAAPHFNALPRAFPGIKMVALDTSTRHNLNAQYGIVGVPSLLLFHNGRPAARFNSSSDYSLDSFTKFITKNSGLEPQGKLYVTSVDFNGPVSSVPTKSTDYCLIISWIFICMCIVYLFYYSTWCQSLLDAVRNAWREAEAQHHQHAE